MWFCKRKLDCWLLVLASLMLVLLLAARGRVWAAPGQDPQRQTVPTPPLSTEVPKTEAPPGPGSAPPVLLTSPSTSLLLPTATSILATPVPTATPSVQFTLLPTPVGQTPTLVQMCQPLEKTPSSLRGDELDLLDPCRILVQIPAGAVIEDTLLRLAPRLLTDAPPSEAWLQMRSIAFTLDVLSLGGYPRPGFVFAKPYTVTIRYNQTDVEIGEGRANCFIIAHYDEAAHKWIPLDSQVNLKEKLVSAEFDQPGWLALMMSMTEGKPTRQPVSTPSPLTSGTAITTIAPTPIPSPSSQWEKADNSICFLGTASSLCLLALVAGLYVASKRQHRS